MTTTATLPPELRDAMEDDWKAMLDRAPDLSVLFELTSDPAFRAAFKAGWSASAARFINGAKESN